MMVMKNVSTLSAMSYDEWDEKRRYPEDIYHKDMPVVK
jgi:hypothetical protein